MNATEKAAIVRGLYSALGMFGATFLTTLLTTDNIRDALIVAGIAAFASLGFRGGVEGAIDGNRARTGAILPADVGANMLAGGAPFDPMKPDSWPKTAYKRPDSGTV